MVIIRITKILWSKFDNIYNIIYFCNTYFDMFFNFTQACGHQHFGPDCKYQCHCFTNGSCAKDAGICNNSRCDPGWELSNCSEGKCFQKFYFILFATFNLVRRQTNNKD
jgi:hypothetical protein